MVNPFALEVLAKFPEGRHRNRTELGLQTTLGAEDRGRVGQYLETVREVERRIQKAEAATAGDELRYTVTRDGSPVRTEPYLGAAGHVVVVAPLEDVAVPDLQPRSIDDLVRSAPADVGIGIRLAVWIVWLAPPDVRVHGEGGGASGRRLDDLPVGILADHQPVAERIEIAAPHLDPAALLVRQPDDRRFCRSQGVTVQVRVAISLHKIPVEGGGKAQLHCHGIGQSKAEPPDPENSLS